MARPWWFTSSAREAWRTLLSSLSIRDGQSVLLPAYIGVTDREGSGLFDPVRMTEKPYTFYPLGQRLEIDMSALEAFLSTGNHPAVLAAHYFGFPHASMEALSALCRTYGALLIEDCAHVPGPMNTDSSLGKWGYASFYSLHKMLPVPSGGALCLTGRGVASTFSIPVSSDARPLEQLLRAEWPSIMECRRRNYSWLQNRLKDVEGIEVLYPNIDNHTPHDFPLRILDGMRERLYFLLMEQGMPTVALYYRLIPEISAVDHPNSHMLSSSILNLPVHQDTTIADLSALCDALEESLHALRN